ncbi:MAG TPA: hypothetical protein PKA13_14660 [Geminicoccaceae bacterium]|nr:hypothetical protein [Geminicoccus sp.]HMU51013.1 hypothetical protein [Geminicoccaceae bacterium]
MRPIASICLATVLAACATAPPAPPIETVRSVSGTPDEARERIQAAASGLGLAAQAEPGPGLRLASTGAPPEWADCPTIVIRSDGEVVNRVDFAAPQARMAEVSVGLVPAGQGTTVSLSPSFSATYRDIFRNLPRTGPCASTGVLERTLLDAAG